MRNRILAIAAIAGAIGAPIAAQAQNTSHHRRGRGGTGGHQRRRRHRADQRPAFREYIVRERVPNYTIPDRVVVGGVLPETGVTYYDVPQTVRRDALSLHRGERPDRAGRTAFASHRSGGRVTSKLLPERFVRAPRERIRARTTGHESPARPPLRAGLSRMRLSCSARLLRKQPVNLLSRRSADDLLVQQCRRRHQL